MQIEMTQSLRRIASDAQGIVTGALFASLGVVLFQQAKLVPGGTVGLSLILHELSALRLSAALVLANAAFLLLAFVVMGREFALKTAAALLLTAAFTDALPQMLAITPVSRPLAALIGGLLCGVGMLMLIRHGASLGGLNVVVLKIQQRFGWPAGWTQLGLDACIVLAGAASGGGADRLLVSIIAVVAINLVLVFNLTALHRTLPAAARE